MMRMLMLLLVCIGVNACQKFEYNEYEVKRAEKRTELTTAFNIERLLKLPDKDTLNLVVFGDPHHFYEILNDLVKEINNLPKLDLVIITGDLTDFGTEKEFNFVNEQLQLLKVPFITVIGNHDCLGNGCKLYEDIYGPVNYSFTWNDVRFVGLNTNGREFGFNHKVPDLEWMQQQVADTLNYRHCIFISHVPPFSEDFDNSLETGYTKIMRETKGTIFHLGGHDHDYSLDKHYEDNIWYLNTSSPSRRNYNYVTIYAHSLSKKKFDWSVVNF